MRLKRASIIYIFVCLGLLAAFVTVLLTDKSQEDGSAFSHYEKATVVSKSMIIDEQQTAYKEELLKIQFETGSNKGQYAEIHHSVSTGQQAFELAVNVGDWLIIEEIRENGVPSYYMNDFYRIPYFIGLLLLFVSGLVFFGRMVGVKALIGIGMVLFLLSRGFILQTLHSSVNLYILTLGYCGLISILIVTLVSGFSKKTVAALLGTAGGIFAAGLLSALSIQLMHLTGIDTEEAITLKSSIPTLDFQGILFASILIGALGAILDVAVSIAAAQAELYAADPDISWRALYRRGMNVGRDMMGAMANTLILAYVGGFMPALILLASYNNLPFAHLINTQGIMSELIRALIGSIGLIYAIPLTAILSAMLYCCHNDTKI